LIPAGVETLVEDGHTVLVEAGAGLGTSIADDEYRALGAIIAESADAIFSQSDIILKVKEPQTLEYPLIRKGQIVFTYFHFAANEVLTQAMLQTQSVCIAYETIQLPDGTLPLLTPMSEVAGRMAVQEGAKYLERPMEGRGILLSGVPGVLPANVVILGGGVVGSNAARIAAGIGANVIILDINLERLRYLEDILPPNVRTLYSNRQNILQCIKDADLVIGSVLRRGERTPVLITAEMLKTMKKGAVIVDVAVDQGGSFETSHPTTHSSPTYIVNGVLHYCVSNMPGAVAGTSTYALTNETLPYVRKLAHEGFQTSMKKDPGLRKGLNMAYGKVYLPALADQYQLPLADDLDFQHSSNA
jgi:alanine dehydrogenase